MKKILTISGMSALIAASAFAIAQPAARLLLAQHAEKPLAEALAAGRVHARPVVAHADARPARMLQRNAA